ncbi:Uncharacterised protein [Halioglobus japonicus]|nr:Uncharacterised protein [Halioglobus japonicus]
MILHGNQRGGAKDLALHLLKDENEHVEVHELRGFVSDDLVSALHEAYAVSRGTKAKKFLFSLSLNPPPGENVSTAEFEAAIDQVEEKLGLTAQPRAIVFHEKKGRRHAHAVWSRTNSAEMKAIKLPYYKLNLQDVSRELYIKHDWAMPRGFVSSQERDSKNFTLQQWHQAKRTGKDPRKIKAALQDCWAISDTQAALQSALKERGYALAKGDQRGFVALDHHCEPFSLSKKWLGIPAKDVRKKLTDIEKLPSVDEASEQIAKEMAGHIQALQAQQTSAIQGRVSEIEQKHLKLVEQHRADRQSLAEKQQQRWHAETQLRQARFNKGFRGVLDRVIGRHTKLRKQNECETLLAYQRDRQEKDSLIFSQLDQRRVLETRIERLNTFNESHTQTLSEDMQQYHEVQLQERQRVDFKPKLRGRHRGLGLER